MSLSLMKITSNPKTQGIHQRHCFQFVSKSFKISFSLFYVNVIFREEKKNQFSIKMHQWIKTISKKVQIYSKERRLKGQPADFKI